MKPLTWPKGDDLIREYRSRYGDTTFLSFSRGKDSIGAALALRDKLNVVPVCYMDVPGLSFIEESLDYYERHLFGRHILRIAHPLLYDSFRSMLYQTPDTAEVCGAAELPHGTFVDAFMSAKKQEGITRDCLTATGLRSADSALRNMSIRKHGVIRPTSFTWLPIWWLSKAELLDNIRKSGISLPVDYLYWPRSFDGLQADFIIPLKRERPNDYKKLLEFYPFLDVEILYYEMNRRMTSLRNPEDVIDPVLWRRIEERFIPEPNSGCWIWLAGLNDNGYAILHLRKIQESNVRIHRFVYEKCRGKKLPKKIFACHSCDVPCCINPFHIFAGTQLDNLRDCKKKGRNNRGTKNGGNKLSEDQVRAIRADPSDPKKIALQYDVDPTHIYAIKRRHVWKYLK